MSLCSRVQTETAEQQTTLDTLRTLVERVIKHMRTVAPHESAWKNLKDSWNGEVVLNTTPFRAEYEPEYGCLSIGVPRTGAPYQLPLLTARLLLTMSRVASGGRRCTDLHNMMLGEVKNTLGIPVEVGCDDIQLYSLMNTPWRNDACEQERLEWPELVGSRVDLVVRYFDRYHPDKRVEIFPWDSLNAQPAAPDVIRITYETRSRKVVNPAPHIGTANIPFLDGSCFSRVDSESTVRCIGAPRVPPQVWGQLIGKSVIDAVDSLRFKYPHAVIEATPTSASIPTDRRQDRIRVWFDPVTAKIDRLPTIG